MTAIQDVQCQTTHDQHRLDGWRFLTGEQDIAHHSVQIYIRYVDNIMTLYFLRCPSGHLLNYT